MFSPNFTNFKFSFAHFSSNSRGSVQERFAHFRQALFCSDKVLNTMLTKSTTVCPRGRIKKVQKAYKVQQTMEIICIFTEIYSLLFSVIHEFIYLCIAKSIFKWQIICLFRVWENGTMKAVFLSFRLFYGQILPVSSNILFY